MQTGVYNIDNTETKLIDGITATDKQFTIERLFVANTDTEEIEVTLFLDDGATHFYILHGVKVPQDVTLDIFDGLPFQFDSTYDLYINLASGETASAIINYY